MTKRALARVGEAAIAVRMSDVEVGRDPVSAMTIAMDSMRGALGLKKPDESGTESDPGAPAPDCHRNKEIAVRAKP